MKTMKSTTPFQWSLLLAIALLPYAAFAQHKVVYQDKLGQKTEFVPPVHRAVVLQLYEFMPALHCWNQVVGVGRYAYQNPLIQQTKPDIEKSIPSVGSGIDLNTEALFKLKPDMVVTWTYKPEIVQYLREHGVRTIAVYPDSVGELYDVTRLLGTMFHREKEAAFTLQQMDGIFNTIRARTNAIPVDQRKKVLWLGGRQNNVAASSDLIDNVLNLIGGRNVAGGIKQRNADVSIETIIGWNPEVIFIWGDAKYSANDILNSPQWQHVKAVRNRQVYKVPKWSIWSPRLAPVSLWMAMKLYPERYHDMNFYSVTDSFNRKVFGVPLGKADAGAF
jgi:iron complex transport system substrate-binding protein